MKTPVRTTYQIGKRIPFCTGRYSKSKKQILVINQNAARVDLDRLPGDIEVELLRQKK